MEELQGDGRAILLRAEAMGADELARLILALQALYSRRLDAAMPKTPPTIYYERRYTRCGKPNCRPCRDGEGHGPYWYAKWREGGRLRSKYLGKGRPPGVAAEPG